MSILLPVISLSFLILIPDLVSGALILQHQSNVFFFSTTIMIASWHGKVKACLVIVFVFYFRFLVFKGKRKKIFFFCFQNEKHVWLVVLKNTFFKNKIQEICLVVVFEKVEFCFL